MDRETLRQQIDRATRLVDARPSWKQDILARSSQSTLSAPRAPCLREEREDNDTHPAYYRGQDAGVEGACMRIEEVLDGKPIAGTVQNLRLDSLRIRIAELMQSLAVAEARIVELESTHEDEHHEGVIEY